MVQRKCCKASEREVTLQAAFVTPLIVNYYKQEPWIWRSKRYRLRRHRTPQEQAHWQTDVIAAAFWEPASILGDDTQHAAIGSDFAARRDDRYQ